MSFGPDDLKPGIREEREKVAKARGKEGSEMSED